MSKDRYAKSDCNHTLAEQLIVCSEGYCPLCLRNKLLCADENSSYWNAIFDGSWPQAIELLEGALERAKRKKDEAPAPAHRHNEPKTRV